MTAPSTPITLVDPREPAAPAATATDWPLFAAIVLPALLVIVSVHLRWHWLRSTPMPERAFRSLARQRGVPPRRRRLVRALAAMLDDAEPVALLVSTDALQRAAVKFNARGMAYPPGTSPKDLQALLAAPPAFSLAAGPTPAPRSAARPAAAAPRPR